ncbi:MAG: RNA polymerase sigma factor [Polyangiaceae bacterium]|nr:RNA polymerase sigma factor [Polyangiaceae bacterium]
MQAALAIQPSWPVGVGSARERRVALDEELIARCKAGDTVAFRELFRLHRADVARLVQRMLGRPTDVDDVVQEVFLQVYRSVGDFQGKSRFSTWLYRVTVNVVLMHRRAARSRPTLVEQPEGMTPRDPDPLPDEQAARHARVQAFGRLLERISEKKRTVFVLHELQGLGAAEIADVVGAPVLTVRTRLFYARRELEAMLKEEPTLAALVPETAAPEDES